MGDIDVDEIPTGKNKKKKIGIIILLVLLVILIAACGAYLYIRFMKDKDVSQVELGTEVINEQPEEIIVPQTGIGKDRAIAVMIDNHKEAMPHANLSKAMIVYEIIVEGGESRLMAVFKGVDVDKIGPIRSSRHYFLDYAIENDAIYVHYGWSPQAQSDISSLGVNNINGISESSTAFWRVKDKSAPHNVVTTTEKIKEIAERKGYRTTSDSSLLLNYVGKEFSLDSADAIVADTIKLPYSDSNKVTYEYDAQTKKYNRFSKGIQEKDWDSGEPVQVKNIIVTFVKNSVLNDGENKDRQTLSNIGTFDGYYITDGKAIKITCTKDSRKSQTVYKDESGKEIDVNDGNTFIQIVPIDSKVEITGTDTSETAE